MEALYFGKVLKRPRIETARNPKPRVMKRKTKVPQIPEP